MGSCKFDIKASVHISRTHCIDVMIIYYRAAIAISTTAPAIWSNTALAL
jgi:hypothetical protein